MQTYYVNLDTLETKYNCEVPVSALTVKSYAQFMKHAVSNKVSEMWYTGNSKELQRIIKYLKSRWLQDKLIGKEVKLPTSVFDGGLNEHI